MNDRPAATLGTGPAPSCLPMAPGNRQTQRKTCGSFQIPSGGKTGRNWKPGSRGYVTRCNLRCNFQRRFQELWTLKMGTGRPLVNCAMCHLVLGGHTPQCIGLILASALRGPPWSVGGRPQGTFSDAGGARTRAKQNASMPELWLPPEPPQLCLTGEEFFFS